MAENAKGQDRKGIWLLSTLFGFVGALCCLTPIVMVLLGLATISAANSWGNVLYGEYKWAFRAAAVVFLVLGLVVYFRRRGICTLDDARRQRNRIINFSLLALIFGIGIYLFWNYIVLHYWGIAVGLPWSSYDESWAIPASIVVFAAAIFFYWVQQRRARI